MGSDSTPWRGDGAVGYVARKGDSLIMGQVRLETEPALFSPFWRGAIKGHIGSIN